MKKRSALAVLVVSVASFAVLGAWSGSRIAAIAERNSLMIIHQQDDLTNVLLRSAIEERVRSLFGLLEGAGNILETSDIDSVRLIHNLSPAIPPWISVVCAQKESREACGRRNFDGVVVPAHVPGWGTSVRTPGAEPGVDFAEDLRDTAMRLSFPLAGGKGHVAAYGEFQKLIAATIADATLPGYTHMEVYSDDGRLLYHPNATYIGKTWEEIESFESMHRNWKSEEEKHEERVRGLFISGASGTAEYLDNNLGGTRMLSHYGPFPGIPGCYLVFNHSIDFSLAPTETMSLMGTLAGGLLGAVLSSLLGLWLISSHNASLRKEQLASALLKAATQKELELIVDSISPWLFCVGSDMKIRRANASFRNHLLAMGISDALGFDVGKAVHPDILDQFLEKGTHPAEWTPKQFETSCDGRQFIVLQTPIFMAGKETEMLFLVDDISEAASLRDALVKSEKRVSASILAGSVAHEINNALTGALGYAELLGKTPDDPENTRKSVHLIQTLLKRIVVLARNLMSLSKPAKPAIVPVEVNQLFSELADRMHEMGVTKHFRVERRFDDSNPIVAGDPGMMEQALTNLIINACQAMSPGGALNLATSKEGRDVRLLVEDSGPGISPEILPHLFEPFFTTKGKEGTGLGLYVTRQIAESHGGRIEVKTEIGKGTSFSLILPAVTSGWE